MIDDCILQKTQIGADVNYHHLNHGERFEMKLQCQDSALMMPKTCLGRSSLVDRRMELARVQDADDMQPAASRELELVDGELSFPVRHQNDHFCFAADSLKSLGNFFKQF